MKALILLLALAGGASGFKEAVLFFTGASCFEELDVQALERFELLTSHPLDLNSASRSSLLSCGLFSSFQVASLLETRQRTGDILSYAELALVDGFGERMCDALKPFTVLRTCSPPGKAGTVHPYHDISARSSVRDGDFSAGLKYSMLAADRFSAAVAASYSPSSCSLTASASFRFRRIPLYLVVGDFNARFGQGVALWSGFSTSGFPSATSFSRNGTGFSPSTGYSSSSHRGCAVELSPGRWNIAAGLSVPGLRQMIESGEKKLSLLPVLAVSRTGRTATFGLVSHAALSSAGTMGVLSGNFRISLPSVSVYGEAAVSGGQGQAPGVASLAGAMWVPAYGVTASFLGRYYSPAFCGDYSGASGTWSGVSDEAGAAAAFSCRYGGISVDWAVRPSSSVTQLKSIASIQYPFGPWGCLTVTPSARACLRYKPSDPNSLRSDLRADILAKLEDFSFSLRYNTVICLSRSWLFYAEAGWRSLYVRYAIFKVDDWDDRIYAYERDAPGSFSVPSFYGRGWKLSLYAKEQLGSRHTVYLRASRTAYPWTDPPKQSRYEIKLQYSLKL